MPFLISQTEHAMPFPRSVLITPLLPILMLVYLLASAASATTFYVDGWLGDNANDGLAATSGGGHGPVRNISIALTISSSNDLIRVARGFYQESNWLPAGQTIQLAADGPVYIYDRDPLTADSDSDGIPDAWEGKYGLDAFNPTDAGQTSANPWAHGLTNTQVYQNPSVLLADNFSTLSDGIPDWWKVQNGLSLTDSSKSAEFVGLISWWPLDEGSGTNALDVSWNELDGVLTGSPLPTWTSGMFTNALAFDGTQNEVRVPNNALLSLTNAVTLAAWLQTASTNTGVVVAKWADDDTAGSYSLAVTNGQVVFEVSVGNEFVSMLSTNAFSDNTYWHHVAGTYDGAKLAVYLDGVLDSTGSLTGAVNVVTNALIMGELDGKLSDVLLYSRALSTNEVQAIWNAGDSDGDGIPNGWEKAHNSDPLNPADAYFPSANPWAHGLTNLQVYQNPSVLLADNYSTLGDGLPDWWKVKNGFSITNPFLFSGPPIFTVTYPSNGATIYP